MRSPRKPPLPQFWGDGKKRQVLFLSPQDWRLEVFFLPCLLLILAVGPLRAAPPKTSPPAKAAAPAPAAIPDYGGRDSAPLTVGDAAPNPAAQAGRALEALVIVLAGVIGVVYALKRFGLVTPGTGGKPSRITLGRMASPPSGASSARSPITVVSTQTLPGGTLLHVVSVAGRTLLLAATTQTVTTVAEWPTEPDPSEEAAFADYLARADAKPASDISAANLRLRSLLSPQPEE